MSSGWRLVIMNVSGLSVNDILSMDWTDVQKLNRRDLSQLTSRLASAGNKRLRRLEKAGLEDSPAYSAIQRSGGDFSVKNKTINDLRSEYNRVRTFLSPTTKTSSVRGARQVEKEFKKRLGFKEGEDMTDYQRKKFWEGYRMFEENNKAQVHNIGSGEIQQMMRDVQRQDKRMSGRRLAYTFENNINLNKLYEERQSNEEVYSRTRFYNFDEDESDEELPFS